MKSGFLALCSALMLAACAPQADSPPAESAETSLASSIARGAYLADIGGCHDCHTPGWAPGGGAAPEALLLTGSPVGYSGGWGTSYATNLRQSVQTAASREAWIETARSRQSLPPMPWWALHRMEVADVGALYDYIYSLGEGGGDIPAPVPPGSVPQGPFIWFEPVGPEMHPASAPLAE